MLNEKEFKDLYEKYYGKSNSFKQKIYSDYLNDANMFEDYLDIFRGKNTRKDRAFLDSNNWYYDHPFFNGVEPKLKEKPCVKFIMIGEAKPVPLSPIYNDCGGDVNNTYFYNVTHLKNTRWLSEPFKAFNTTQTWNKIECPSGKAQILLELAAKGYLLIDLFPFPFPSPVPNNLRNKLNNSGISSFFFTNYLTHRLKAVSGLNCSEDCFVAFSGPSTIHHYLVHELATGNLSLPNGFSSKLDVNYFIQPLAILPQISPALMNWDPVSNLLNNNYHNPGMKQVPYYRCETWDGSNTGPHWLMIQNAFY